MADPVIVPVKSAWSSRVNQIAIAVFGLAVPLGTLTPFLPEPWKGYSLTVVSLLGAFGIWYYRTFQTGSVTPQSVSQASSAVSAMAAAGVSEHLQTETLNALQSAKIKEKTS